MIKLILFKKLKINWKIIIFFRIEHYLQIIKHGEQQFSLIQALIAYCRLRLIKEKINIFVDLNKCLSASNVLPISIDATLTELEKAKKNLFELEELILRVCLKLTIYIF